MTNEKNTFGHAVVGVAKKGTEASVGALRDNPTKVKIHLEKNERSQTYSGGSLLCVVAHSIGVDDDSGTASKFVTGKGKAPTGQQTTVHSDLCLAIAQKAFDEVGNKTPKVIAWIDAQVSALTADATDDTDDADRLVFDDSDDDDEAPAPTTTAEVVTPTGDGATAAELVAMVIEHGDSLIGQATDILVASGHRVILDGGRIKDQKVARPSWATDWKHFDDALFTYRVANFDGICALFSKKSQVITQPFAEGQRSWVYTLDGRKKPIEKDAKWAKMDVVPALSNLAIVDAMALVHAALVVKTGGDCWNVDPRVYLDSVAVGELATMETDSGAWFKDDLTFKGRSFDLPLKKAKARGNTDSGDPLTTALGFF